MDVEQFQKLYDHQSGYEYWFGKAIQIPTPTWTHGILQALLAEIIDKAGYFSASELTLRTYDNWQPRPDVAGALELEQPYPIKPIDIAIEKASKDQDPPLIEKCTQYARIGVPQILTFDPEARIANQWKHETQCLERVETIVLTNQTVIHVDDVWRELERRLQSKRKGS